MLMNTNLPVAVFITTTHWFLKKVRFVVGLGKTEGFYKKTKSPPLQEQHQRCRVTHLEFPTAAALPETPSTHCSSLADGKKEKEYIYFNQDKIVLTPRINYTRNSISSVLTSVHFYWFENSPNGEHRTKDKKDTSL